MRVRTASRGWVFILFSFFVHKCGEEAALCEGATGLALELAFLCVCRVSEHGFEGDPLWARTLAGLAL